MKCLTIMAVAALAFATVAQGADHGDAPRSRPMRSMMGGQIDPIVRAALRPNAVEKLGLTEDQAAKIKALSNDKSELKSLHEKVRNGMNRQNELMRAEKIDEAAVLAAIDEVFEARKAIAKVQTKRVIAVKSILTPEQIKKASEMIRPPRRNRNAPKEGKPPAKE